MGSGVPTVLSSATAERIFGFFGFFRFFGVVNKFVSPLAFVSCVRALRLVVSAFVFPCEAF